MQLPLLTAAVLCCAVRATACPFCTAVAPSLSERRADAAVAFLGELQSVEGTQRQFAVHKVFTGAELLADPKRLLLEKTDIADNGGLKSGQLVLALATRRTAQERLLWELVPLDELSYAYVARAPARRQPAAERLAYYAKYLEHASPVVAEDAYREFGAASYDDVALVADNLPYGAMRRWVVDPRVPEARKGFYGLALGLARADDDRRANEETLRKLIDAPADDFRGGFDGVLGGYLVLTHTAGLKHIEQRFLANADARIGDVRHAMTALRFFHEFGRGAIPTADLKAALCKTLRRPEVAAAAIVDLARWEDWELLTEITALWDREGYTDRPTSRAIVGYLAACPRPEAAEALARLRRASPARVAEAESETLGLPGNQ